MKIKIFCILSFSNFLLAMQSPIDNLEKKSKGKDQIPSIQTAEIKASSTMTPQELAFEAQCDAAYKNAPPGMPYFIWRQFFQYEQDNLRENFDLNRN